MNLWIRTQNRMRLFNISLDVSVIGILDEKGNIDHYMIGCNDYEMDYELGTYKSKERALEVLDEIQNCLLWAFNDEELNSLKAKKYTTSAFISMKSNNLIYEMPLE